MRKETTRGTKQSYKWPYEASDQASLNGYISILDAEIPDGSRKARVSLHTSTLLGDVVSRWENHESRGDINISDTRLPILALNDYRSQGLVYPMPDIQVPVPKDTLKCLVQKPSLDELDDCKFIGFPALFRDIDSSIHYIVDKAIPLVEPEVLGLQGRTLTPQL